MHKDISHNAFAHYGIRNQRYKLIYWYNDALGQPGANVGDEAPEWEMFDCQQDPLELVNVYGEAVYAEARAELMAQLDTVMADIGDIPEHR